MTSRRFIDLFAGCGGFSLGLSWAGAQGVFAVERDPMAFQTFKANLIDAPCGEVRPFDWPAALGSPRPWPIDELMELHSDWLPKLRGTVDILAGGPPCQGFSMSGRRNADDPRNLLFEKYLEFVRLVKPSAVVLENVPGMAVAEGYAFGGYRSGKWKIQGSRAEQLIQGLEKAGYDVDWRVVDASRFGVPQRRWRLVVVGISAEKCDPAFEGKPASRVFDRLEADRRGFLDALGLGDVVSAEEAIGDLSIRRKDGSESEVDLYKGSDSKGGFCELVYDGRRSRSRYQRLMREHARGRYLDSMRMARHSLLVKLRFERIILECQPGARMTDKDRETHKIRKQRVHPMSESAPAPTITTLPDDVVHYRDPRILTVRECARIQSFPDWFEFKGKYTTGGDRRTKECPRYTQVGNAVPPLLGRAIGLALAATLDEIEEFGRKLTRRQVADRVDPVAAIA